MSIFLYTNNSFLEIPASWLLSLLFLRGISESLSLKLGFFCACLFIYFLILNEVHSQHCFLDGSVGMTDLFLQDVLGVMQEIMKGRGGRVIKWQSMQGRFVVFNLTWMDDSWLSIFQVDIWMSTPWEQFGYLNHKARKIKSFSVVHFTSL